MAEYEDRLMDRGLTDLSNDALLRVGEALRKEKVKSAGPLPHWCRKTTTSKAAGSPSSSSASEYSGWKELGPVACTVPMPKRAFSMPPPPPYWYAPL